MDSYSSDLQSVIIMLSSRLAAWRIRFRETDRDLPVPEAPHTARLLFSREFFGSVNTFPLSVLPRISITTKRPERLMILLMIG